MARRRRRELIDAGILLALLNVGPQLVPRSVTKQRIELNVGHVGFGDIGYMAACTFGRRPFF